MLAAVVPLSAMLPMFKSVPVTVALPFLATVSEPVPVKKIWAVPLFNDTVCGPPKPSMNVSEWALPFRFEMLAPTSRLTVAADEVRLLISVTV